jgi:ribosomal protein L29
MKAKEIRSMTIGEIESKLIELHDKLFKQKIQNSLGDIVKIKLVRPISKRKKWMLLDVISTTPDKEVIK